MDKFLAPAPEPQTELGRYRLFSPRAGVRVSPIQLGCMSIGDRWSEYGFAPVDKKAAFTLLDTYFDNGGNIIDTANNYQEGASEQFIGEWAEKRGIRDQLFIATKYTTNFVKKNKSVSQQILYTGNSAKSMKVSVENSLKNLRTDYIDLLYVHWWDWETSVEEVMQALNRLVVAGKVLYLGISDTPAWVVSKANQYARGHGLAQFVVYQGQWSVLDRSFEREIIPMAYSEGMALAPWGVLGGGKLRSDEEEQKRMQTCEKGRMFSGNWERNDNEKKMSHALSKVAAEVGTKHITAVAIAYVMQKAPYVFPIIGGRKPEHLMANIDALKISLSPQQMKFLEDAITFDLGFPASMIGTGEDINKFIKATGPVLHPPRIQPIRPGVETPVGRD